MKAAARKATDDPPWWPDLRRRRVRDEWMDDPALDPTEHARALAGLERINRISLVGPQVWRLVRPIAEERARMGRTLRLMDVACGGGDLLTTLGRRCRDAGLACELTACDISATALERAGEMAKRARLDIRTLQRDVLRESTPDRAGFDDDDRAAWDVVTCSLFLHHIEAIDDIVHLLVRARQLAGRRLIVGDLRRTRLGHVMASLGSRALSRSPVVHFDAPVSVEAALTKAELTSCAKNAGLEGARIVNAWPQRMMLVWDRANGDASREGRAT